MAEKKKKKKKGKKKKRRQDNDINVSSSSSSAHKSVNGILNYVNSAVYEKGCHVAWGGPQGDFYENIGAAWAIECVAFIAEEWGGTTDLPDFSIDPDSRILTVINASESRKSYFVSLMREFLPARDVHGNVLVEGKHVFDKTSNPEPCVTLVIVLEPRTVADVCYLSAERPRESNDADATPSFFSDIKDVADGAHMIYSGAADEHHRLPVVGFPLDKRQEASYLCTQGHCGKFTHFFPGTLHAVDFQCTVGTPVVAVGDGIVVAVRQSSTARGIHAQNLFKWNSVMLRLADSDDGRGPLYVEYVHILAGSVCVHVGDTVAKGQEICKSGAAGFCPDPHLHLQFHRSSDPDSATVPVAFSGLSGDIFVPRAGHRYS